MRGRDRTGPEPRGTLRLGLERGPDLRRSGAGSRGARSARPRPGGIAHLWTRGFHRVPWGQRHRRPQPFRHREPDRPHRAAGCPERDRGSWPARRADGSRVPRRAREFDHRPEPACRADQHVRAQLWRKPGLRPVACPEHEPARTTRRVAQPDQRPHAACGTRNTAAAGTLQQRHCRPRSNRWPVGASDAGCRPKHPPPTCRR